MSQPGEQEPATSQIVGTAATASLWQPTLEPRSQRRDLRVTASDKRKKDYLRSPQNRGFF